MRAAAIRSAPVRPRAKGFSLIETGIVLAIVSLVVGAVWVAGSRASRTTEILLAGEQLRLIVDNVRGLYLSRRGIFVDNTQATVNGALCGAANFNARLSCLGVYPSTTPGNPAYHVWNRVPAGGSVVVVPRAVNLTVPAVAPGTASFGVQFIGLPVDVCTTMAMRYSVPDQKYDLKALLFFGVGGGLQNAYANPSNAVPDWTQGGARAPLPVTLAQATAECRTATAVEWVYGLR
jgi:type II secretory pathway pseudopilin PulG